MTTPVRPPVADRIWDPAETLPRPHLEALQLQRLGHTLERLAGVPFYREALAERGIRPGDISTLAELQRLPFTTKADLRQHHPLGLAAVPRRDMARIHGSSGTTGRPTFVAYTAADLDTWAGLCARFLVAGGVQPDHTVHVAFGYGLFTGGFGLHYGIERVGATVVPAASGNTRRQIDLIRDLGAQVLVCTPSYALTIAEAAREAGLGPADLPLELGQFGAEPWSEDMRGRIEQALGIQAFNNYGLSEVIGPGVSGECPQHQGMHIQEDHFIVECLHPETLEPVPDGTPGELVFTALTKQAMPLLRYRSRDIASLDRSPCPCGRTTVRMSRVRGRSDDMLIIRGVNVFPSQIEEALLRVEGTAPHYLIEVDRPGTLDQVRVQVELSEDSGSYDQLAMQRHIAREIQTVTGIRAEILVVEPYTLERSTGKARRVLDHRRFE
jgi:phenylacetate-CoA ligase